MTRVPIRIILAPLILAAGSLSCSPIIAPFSQQAYQYAIELKVDSLKLMDLAEVPFEESEKRVDQHLTDIEKAYEFAKGRPRNEHSTRQWELIMDPDQNLLGGFVKRWKAQGSLSYPFIFESKRIVGEAFDAVIELESGKVQTNN
jgi:hypothetical protein